MPDSQPRSVRCRDVAGRDGAVAVIARANEAVLTVPPGEAARLTGPQVTQLINALREVRDELFQADQ